MNLYTSATSTNDYGRAFALYLNRTSGHMNRFLKHERGRMKFLQKKRERMNKTRQHSDVGTNASCEGIGKSR